MTVRELIGILSAMDQDRIIVLSNDEEGNGYRPLYNIAGDCAYNDGDIGIEKLTVDDIEAGFSEEDVMTDGKACVVFW